MSLVLLRLCKESAESVDSNKCDTWDPLRRIFKNKEERFFCALTLNYHCSLIPLDFAESDQQWVVWATTREQVPLRVSHRAQPFSLSDQLKKLSLISRAATI
jgi:hypothetical protein